MLLASILFSTSSDACVKGAQNAERELAYAQGVQLVINGVKVETQEPLWVWRGVTYLPLEYSTLLQLNLQVEIFDGETGRTLQVRTDGTTLAFTEERCEFTVNEVRLEAPGAPLVNTAVPAVPLRAFFDALGAKTVWAESEKKIYIALAVEKEEMEALPSGFFSTKGGGEQVVAAPKTPEPAVPAVEQPAAATETVAIDEAPPPEKKFQYTYENTTGVDSADVSGDTDASYIEDETITHNLFQLRASDLLSNGYEMSATVRTVQTTDEERKSFEFEKMTFGFTKGAKIFELYDLYPKFSHYMMRSYRLQGVRYVRGAADSKTGFEVVAGKSPKKARDSEYARYVTGANFRTTVGDMLMRMNYVRADDTGTLRDGEPKVRNEVYSVEGSMPLLNKWKMIAEYAGGGTDGEGSGRARFVSMNYQAKKTRVEIKYERTGTGFQSETSFYPKARSEIAVTYQRKPTERITYAFGHKQRQYRGDRTFFYPVSLSVRPIKSRTGLKIDLWREFQRTVNGEYEGIDERGMRLVDRLGQLIMDLSFSRRKTKDYDGTLYKTTRALKLRRPFSEKMYVSMDIFRERRQLSTTPLARSVFSRVEYEIAPWTDLVLGAGRFYNATSQNSEEYSVGFRKVNIFDDWEVGFDVKLKNYSDHNDLTMKARYTIIR